MTKKLTISQGWMCTTELSCVKLGLINYDNEAIIQGRVLYEW